MPSGNKPWPKPILTKIYVAICIYDSSEQNELTHQGTVTYLYDNELCNQWFCYWRLVFWAPSHYLNWCWSIVDLTLGNIYQRNLNDDKKNSSSGMYLQMSSVSWRPFCFAFNVLNAAANYTILYTCDMRRITQCTVTYYSPRPGDAYPDSNVHGANMGPIWGRQDPGGLHV